MWLHVSDTASFTITPPPPTIILSPAGGGVTLQAGGSGTIKVTTSTPLASSLIVTLTSGNANVAKLGSPPAASHAVTLQASSTSMPSSAQDSVSGLSAGTTTISASTPGIQSTPAAKIKVTVSAVAPPPKAAVFRTSSTDVQSLAFSSTNTWVPVDTQPATFSPGKFVVGLALSGSGALLRIRHSSVHDQSRSNANTRFRHGSFSIRYRGLCRQSRDKCNSHLQQRHTNLHARRDNSAFGRIQEHWSQRYRNWS